MKIIFPKKEILRFTNNTKVLSNSERGKTHKCLQNGEINPCVPSRNCINIGFSSVKRYVR